MKKVLFKKGVFLTSALKTSELPEPDLPEIAIVGRSNVGKSSLINHLLHTKGVAKVSSTPGKTERINYFTVDEALFLVDLPGYGYARKSKQIQRMWGEWIDLYLKTRNLKLVIFLVDARRAMTEEDKQFVAWATHAGLPLLLVVTKKDKLNQSEQSTLLKRLESDKSLSVLPRVLYSIKEGRCRDALIHEINKKLSLN